MGTPSLHSAHCSAWELNLDPWWEGPLDSRVHHLVHNRSVEQCTLRQTPTHKPNPNPQIPNPDSQIPNPQIPDSNPQIPDPQIPNPEIPDSNPQIPDPQIPNPQIPNPQIPNPSPVST